LGLLNAEQYAKDPERCLATYTRSLVHDRGQIRLTIVPGSEEGWKEVLLSLHLLGDELVDTFLALLAIALDTHGIEHLTLPLTLQPTDLLAVCQKQTLRGQYSRVKGAITRVKGT
jgi:hypothetical protein